MERNISAIADTSNQDQKSPDDQKRQSPSQEDTRITLHRQWIS